MQRVNWEHFHLSHEILSAEQILYKAAEIQKERGKTRDVEQNHSMSFCVDAFNHLTGHTLSEKDGWTFMVLLKLSRAQQGEHHDDDYLDAVGYAALLAECACK